LGAQLAIAAIAAPIIVFLALKVFSPPYFSRIKQLVSLTVANQRALIVYRQCCLLLGGGAVPAAAQPLNHRFLISPVAAIL
jgi:hypothetical protein